MEQYEQPPFDGGDPDLWNLDPREADCPQLRVLSQKVDFDVDMAGRRVTGKTELTVQPTSAHLRRIQLNARGMDITRCAVQGRGARKDAVFEFDDPYERLQLHRDVGLHQYRALQKRVAKLRRRMFQTEETEQKEETLPQAQREYSPDALFVHLPKGIRIHEIDPSSVTAGATSLADGTTAAADFEPLKVFVEFEITEFRDGLYFAGVDDGTLKYPHLYTRTSRFPGSASCIFPCVDRLDSRCTWEISIRYPRTLGDAIRPSKSSRTGAGDRLPPGAVNGVGKDVDGVVTDADDNTSGFTEEEKALDMAVICSGDLTDDIIDPTDPTRKTSSFVFMDDPVSPQHIGFTLGPFEHVDLSDFRESDQDEKMGQSATRIHAFCLPGRADEVRNSCMGLAQAIDFFTLRFGPYPYTSYKLTFVDDLIPDVTDAASLSICSTRLLFPEDILEPIDTVTRTLFHALATQWIGVNIIPAHATDWWLVIGGAWYMTDQALQMLCGRNDHRFRQKMMANRLYEMDKQRPSIYELGRVLQLHPTELEFMNLKSALVLFTLNQRMMKLTGRNGLTRVFNKIFLDAKVGRMGDEGLTSESFQHTCEKVGHLRLEDFFQQWVHGAGCPEFTVNVKFNKKNSSVDVTLLQIQGKESMQGAQQPFLTAPEFMREVKEHNTQVWAPPLLPTFTGPMTIRVHEADGTPQEHIVQIKDRTTKVQLPYNTKYKRLKRSRRQKERAAAAAGVDISGESQDDVLLYCLGDVLQTEEEVEEWRLVDWSKEDEERMNQESYEWLRIDADFEWLCRSTIDMPHYMYVSQLQQDKDIVAQIESIQYLSRQKPFPIISSILVRTLMDTRYFHGIRTMAANALARCAQEELDWIGLFHLEKAFQEFFCLPNSPMTRSNDFSDRSAYIMQCAIPRAIAQVRDLNGKAPMRVKRFFIDKLKFNDNSNNEYSDSHYVATLMSCLAQALSAVGQPSGYDFDMEDAAEDAEFKRQALAEIRRYQRIDEWIPSFQNVFTITALDCVLMLMKSKVIPKSLKEFVQYTRPGNADNVRLKAAQCLVELGVLKRTPLSKFIFCNLESDPSPYIRQELLMIVETGIGAIALGDIADADEPKDSLGGLTIEGDDNTRADLMKRKTSVEGALEALKRELGTDPYLADALESALRSRHTSLFELEELTELCSFLYPAKDQHVVKLAYPRYWKVAHLGHGRLRFYHSERVRTAPRPLPPPPPPSQPTKLEIKMEPATAGFPPLIKSLKHTIAPPQPPPPKRSHTLTLKAPKPEPSPADGSSSSSGGVRLSAIPTQPPSSSSAAAAAAAAAAAPVRPTNPPPLRLSLSSKGGSASSSTSRPAASPAAATSTATATATATTAPSSSRPPPPSSLSKPTLTSTPIIRAPAATASASANPSSSSAKPSGSNGSGSKPTDHQRPHPQHPPQQRPGLGSGPGGKLQHQQRRSLIVKLRVPGSRLGELRRGAGAGSGGAGVGSSGRAGGVGKLGLGSGKIGKLGKVGKMGSSSSSASTASAAGGAGLGKKKFAAGAGMNGTGTGVLHRTASLVGVKRDRDGKGLSGGVGGQSTTGHSSANANANTGMGGRSNGLPSTPHLGLGGSGTGEAKIASGSANGSATGSGSGSASPAPTSTAGSAEPPVKRPKLLLKFGRKPGAGGGGAGGGGGGPPTPSSSAGGGGGGGA